MIEVKINDDSQGTFEKAMKRFKKLCQEDSFMLELRERRYFIKKSVKKRQKKLEVIRKQKIEIRKNKDK